LELDRMGRTSGSDAGGWLLEWWSSGRAEVSQLGLAAVSYKKGCRHCPPYLCQVGSMIADPSMSASGRLPHVGSTTLTG
ncbi:hypothetical protein GW17_00055654, partial [Ensete ventricosum]